MGRDLLEEQQKEDDLDSILQQFVSSTGFWSKAYYFATREAHHGEVLPLVRILCFNNNFLVFSFFIIINGIFWDLYWREHRNWEHIEEFSQLATLK